MNMAHEEDDVIKQLAKHCGLNERHISIIQGNQKLAHFLRQISGHLSPSGSSVRVEKLFEQVNEKMRCAKTRYLQKSIIYDEIRMIVLTSMQLQEAKIFSSDYQFPVLRQLLAVTAAKAKVGSESHVKLLDDDDFPSLKVPNHELVDMQHKLMCRLRETGTNLAKFYDSITTDEETSGLGDSDRWRSEFIDLPAVVGAMRRRLDETRARSEAGVELRQSLIANHLRLLSKDATLLSSIAQLMRGYNYDEERFCYLSTKLEVFMLKIRAFTLEVEAKTYSTKVVQAHKKISHVIQKAMEAATTKRMVCRQQLSVYESASPEFNALVDEYLRIMRQSEECEWQLMKVRETSKQLPIRTNSYEDFQRRKNFQ